MMQNISKDIILSLISFFSFWFKNPGPASRFELVMISILFALIALSGAGVLIFNKWKVGRYPPKNKILKNLGAGLLTVGLLGSLPIFFRWQGVDFLGVPFVALLFFSAALLWVGYLAYIYKKRLSARILEYEAKKVKKKYLG